MSTQRVFKIYRILVIALSLISTQANAVGLEGSRMAYSPDTNCNSFSKLLHKINVFSDDGQDPRIAQSRIGEGKMFAPIGIIETKNPVPSPDAEDVNNATGERLMKNQRSTAFLVSPCYVLTNYHSVFGSSKEPSAQFAVNFFNFDPETKSYKQTRATPVAWGSLDTKSSKDWALVKLDICVGKKIGWLETDVRDTNTLYNKEVASAGYPGDKKVTDLWIHQSCRLVEQNVRGLENTFLNDCANRKGASGSPIFDLENGYPQVLALQSADLNPDNKILRSYDHFKANIAVDIRSILPKINQLLLEDKKSFVGKNTSLPAQVLAGSSF